MPSDGEIYSLASFGFNQQEKDDFVEATVQMIEARERVINKLMIQFQLDRPNAELCADTGLLVAQATINAFLDASDGLEDPKNTLIVSIIAAKFVNDKLGEAVGAALRCLED